MRHFCQVILPLLVFGSVLWAGDKSTDEGKEDKKATPVEQFKELQDKAKKAIQQANRDIRTATSKEEQQKVIGKLRSERQKLAGRFMELVNHSPKEDFVPSALLWVVQNAQGTQAKKAQDLLLTEHIQAKEVGQLCPQLAFSDAPESEQKLRLILEKNPQKEVKGKASFYLGLFLKMQSETFKRDPAEAAKMKQEAETLFDQVVAKHADQKRLVEQAQGWLFEIHNLSIGKPALEIEGEDRDGKKFKLSDYRGKVVVLDFWAGWCGPCMAMVPHERELVKRLEGKPFALVGVNFDKSTEDEKAAEEKNHIPWRSWFDGREGPIGKKWNIQFYPTIYILDAQGIIRYKGLRDKEMEEAVAELLKETQAKK